MFHTRVGERSFGKVGITLKREKNYNGETKMAQDKLQSAFADIEKSLGLTIGKLNEQKIEPLQRLSSGSLSFDIALGGGYAFGRVHEIFGMESTGKTMLTLFATAQAQREGLTVAFIDVEHAMDPTHAAKLGVDVQNLIYTQPDYGEQALNAVLKLVETKKVQLIVIDSIAGLVPKKEIEGEIGEVTMGLQARMMGQALRKLVPAVSQSNTIVIFLNQLRQKIGVMFGNPETTPGGLALKFYASIRVRASKISKTERFDDLKNLVGHDIKVKAIKNKTAPPQREGIIPINYFNGLLRGEDFLTTATELGLMKGKEYAGEIPELKNLRGATTEELNKLFTNHDLWMKVRKEVLTKAGIV